MIFGELYGNTSATGSDGPENAVPPLPGNPSKTTEISGGETVVSLGYGYYPNQNLQISLSVSYDNNNAVLFHPGIIWTSHDGRNFFKFSSNKQVTKF